MTAAIDDKQQKDEGSEEHGACRRHSRVGCHLVAPGCWSVKDQSAVVVPPDAVIPDTAEWCYPAQTLKWRRGCPDEACMSLALPAAGRDALAEADEQIPSTAHLLQSRLHTSQPATQQGR
jgi:hypothetical protein